MKPEDTKQLIENTGELNTTYLGTRTSIMGVEENVSVKDTDRTLHTMVTGPTGTGKTNLLLTMILQDLQKGYGAAFLNPKGNVINQIIGKMPENRLNDVIYINPAENRCPSINLLKPEIPDKMQEPAQEKQRKLVVSNIMALFRRLTEDWGERWPRNLRTLLTAHVSLNIQNGENNTLMDVYQATADQKTLIDLINRTPDQVTRKQLEEIQELSDREKTPLLRRLSDLLENNTIRKIITQPQSSISFQEALADQKIILVDAQAGNIGDWASRIIGSVVLTQLWSATAARNTIPENQRPPFHIYIDEVQEFISEADHLRRMLSQCREFNVSLTVATQYLDDLDTTMKRAILNNTMTKAVFSPGASDDLTTFTRLMQGLTKNQLSQLGKYRPAIQLPAEHELPDAITVDTYPPWKTDHNTINKRKEELLQENESLEDTSLKTEPSTGDSAASGSQAHDQLLKEAKQYLEFQEDVQVQIQFQDGTDRPDATVVGNGEVRHLEAEHTTLTKPDKVLKNLERATNQDRTCIYIVKENQLTRLQNILSDTNPEHYRILILTDLGVTEP